MEKSHQGGLRILFAYPGILLATLFVSLPFVVREVVPVLREIGTEQEEAAATLNFVLKIAPAGTCVLTMIVWFAFVLVRLKEVLGEPPLMLAEAE